MDKLNLNNIEETLFIPMRGRVFVSKKFPYILNDNKAIEKSRRNNYMCWCRNGNNFLQK